MTRSHEFLHSARTSAKYAAEHISARKYSRSQSHCNALGTINKLKCRMPATGTQVFTEETTERQGVGKKRVGDKREHSSETMVREWL